MLKKKSFIYASVISLLVFLLVFYLRNKIEYLNQIYGRINDRITTINSYQNTDNLIKTKCNYKSSGPRILCAVFTYKEAHSKVHYVHNTWGKR